MELGDATSQVNELNDTGSTLDEAQEATENLIDKSKPADQTNGHDGSPASKVSEKMEDTKAENSLKETPNGDRPSQRVQQGRNYNDRPRKQHGNQADRPYKRNNKSDLTSQPESSDPVAIRKQVEFYFSDSNLLTDKFLFTKVEGHENKPVLISMIHSFKRMQRFQPLSAVVDAIKESAVLDVVDNDTCVQRKTPLPEGLVGKPMYEIKKVHEDKSMARSVYVKGFGEEQPSTQFDIEAFFAQYGPTNSVRLRRSGDACFKGSVFVEFDREETQKAFLAINPTPKWQGEELQIKSKKQYCDDKVDDIAAGLVRPKEADHSHYKGGSKSASRGRDGPDHKGDIQDWRDRDGADTRDWRTRREEDQKRGFKDRNGRGKHKGFGSSGRGRGGRRGDRTEGRGQKDEHQVPRIRTSTSKSDDETSALANTSVEVSTKAEAEPRDHLETSVTETAVKNNGSTGDATAGPPSTDSDAVVQPKKRAREDDDASIQQGDTKKLDTKGEEQ